MRPSIPEIISSRSVRLLWVPIALTFLALTFFVHQHDAISRISINWTNLSDQQKSASNSAPHESNGGHDSSVNWSRFAYIQYVTNSHYLCNSVMLFESLHRLGSRADRVMMYPSHMLDPNSPEKKRDNDRDRQLLLKARDEYDAKLVPIAVYRKDTNEETWAESFTKLLAFNQTSYDRVLSLDSDSVVLQPMDELFLLPSCSVAMPRAYWLQPEKDILSSQIMLVQPSAAEFQRVMEAIEAGGGNDYDMEIVNQLYKDNALVLPHRKYNLLSREFAAEDHSKYLGTDQTEWNPVDIFKEAKFVHFSDWPMPKPWLRSPPNLRAEREPKCRDKDDGKTCVERDIWNGFYDGFRDRRQRICGLGLAEPDYILRRRGRRQKQSS
ncbi:nucleotide-diphospho-sugar transferase [Cladorrhinum sp. PSN259]|nr:nucleotide-diphospho-sugar transferase [Cladorrhinum sp. PSN259]